MKSSNSSLSKKQYPRLLGLMVLLILIVTLLFTHDTKRLPLVSASELPHSQISIDTQVEGNSAAEVGTTQSCVAMSGGTNIDIDVVIEDIHDLASFEMTLVYDPAKVKVVAVDVNQFLASLAGSNVVNLSGSLPDSSGSYTIGARDDALTGPDHSGILVRVTLQAVGTGIADIAISSVRLINTGGAALGDHNGDGIYDGIINNATLAIDQVCPVDVHNSVVLTNTLITQADFQTSFPGAPIMTASSPFVAGETAQIQSAVYAGVGAAEGLFAYVYQVDCTGPFTVFNPDLSFPLSGAPILPFNFPSGAALQETSFRFTSNFAGNLNFFSPVFGTSLGDDVFSTVITDDGKFFANVDDGGVFFATPLFGFVSSAPPQSITGRFISSATGTDITVVSPKSTGKILNVPSFKQTDPAWGGLEYDHGNSRSLDCGTTIGQCGCALTSLAMVLLFHGVTQSPDGRPTNPETLNDYFKQNTTCGPRGCTSLGYAYGGSVNWLAASQYSQGKVRWNGDGAHNAATIRADIDNNSPVILQEPGHFIVATGYTDSTFTINDPGFSRMQLDDAAYGNNSLGLRRFVDPQSDSSVLAIAVLAPAQVLITDSNSRRTGFDPSASTVIQEIPNSAYFFDEALADDTGQKAPPAAGAGVHWAIVTTPQSGAYLVQVIAPSGVEYSFAAYAYDRDARLTLNPFEGQAQLDVQPSYTFIYDPIPGAKTLARQVPIDIKPGSDPNSINPRSKGVIPVAILSTATFNATTVDPLSVTFGPGGASEVHNKGHVEDVNGDGKPDLVLHFATEQTGIKNGDDQACLTGKTAGGLSIQGCDSVRIIPTGS